MAWAGAEHGGGTVKRGGKQQPLQMGAAASIPRLAALPDCPGPGALLAISSGGLGPCSLVGEHRVIGAGESQTRGSTCSASELLKMNLLSAGALREEVVEITR